MKSAVVVGVVIGAILGIAGTTVFYGSVQAQKEESSSASLDSGQSDGLEQKLENAKKKIAVKDEILKANRDFLDALHTFELSSLEPTAKEEKVLSARVRVQELRVLVGAERNDPSIVVKATEEVESLAKFIKG